MSAARTPSFAARIARWQRAQGRHDLPWQGTRDPYRIWLSEIMLQQTQVATVVPYYERFVAAFPDVRALADADVVRVLEHWSGLGYYRRAHLAHAAARAIVAGHRGEFPRDAATLATLPGIGRSTAAAIATFAGGEAAPILDGNVKRVLARHRGITGDPASNGVARALWQCAEALFPRRDPIAYTQGLMDLGATLCTRRSPRCRECPVASDCIARKSGRIADLPSPRVRPERPSRRVRMLVLERSGRILFERRPAIGIWGGLWSLPEAGSDEDVAAHCRRRFGATVRAGETLPAIAHRFTHFRLTIEPQRVLVRRWPEGVETPGRAWMTRAEAEAAALPAPVRRLVQQL